MLTKSPYSLPFELKTTAMLSKQLHVPLEVLEHFCDELRHPSSRPLVHRFNKLCGKKERELYNSTCSLKQVNKRINRMLQKAKLPSEIYGGIRGKSIKNNALPHINSRYIYKLDIKNFFPSLHSSKIRELFLRLGCSAQVAKMLTRLSTADSAVPQGFPTSTILGNLYIAVFCHDEIRKIICGKYTISYWVDDITISSKTPISGQDIKKITLSIAKHGLKINEKKTEKLGPKDYKEVTGVAVNGTINPGKILLKALETELHLLRTQTPESIANARYGEKCVELRKEKRKSGDWFIEHTRGRLQHVKSLNKVKGERLTVHYEDVIKAHQIA
jgi:hypothetical protein